MLPGELLEVLVCPRSRAPLIYFPRGEADDDEAHGFLLCTASRLRYRIEDGVAVMLVEEAEELSARDVDRLLGLARGLGLAIPQGLSGA
jgi:uncharacterized protein YbaR (Trm112 family)